MIEFYGCLSNECKIARAKKISKKDGMLFLLWSIIVSIIVLPIGIARGLWYYSLAIILFFVLITTIAFIVPKKKILNCQIPLHILINTESITVSPVLGKKTMSIRPMSHVKKVIDNGTWYEILFKLGDVTNSCACQKDLIIQGSIEEFERLFDGKVIKK